MFLANRLMRSSSRSSPRPHRPRPKSAGFSDPGVLDHQTASLAWGDALALTVRDDDGGEDAESAVVRVVTPEQAVGEVVGLLDQAIAGASSADVRKSLEKARKALAGSNEHSQSGALQKIGAGNTQAALAFLAPAISWLERAQLDGADVALPIALLQQVVLALSV